jgi:hypothetical protein
MSDGITLTIFLLPSHQQISSFQLFTPSPHQFLTNKKSLIDIVIDILQKKALKKKESMILFDLLMKRQDDLQRRSD